MVDYSQKRNVALDRITVLFTEIFWYGTLAYMAVHLYSLWWELTSDRLQVAVVALGLTPRPLLLTAIVFLLRQVVRSERNGCPFIAANVRRMRLMGFCLVIYGPLHIWGSWIQTLDAIKHHNLQFISLYSMLSSFDWEVPVIAIFLGLIVLVLAQVFDMGVRLQADSDLTV